MVNIRMIQSTQTKAVLRLMGQMVENGRRLKGWSEQNLADRAKISRNTLRKIKRGDPTVSAGALFECAYLVGIDLLGDADTRRQETLRIQGTLTLLPKRIRDRKWDVNDDF